MARLLLTTRAIATSRPNNLMTFASQHDSRSISSGDDKETLIVQVGHLSNNSCTLRHDLSHNGIVLKKDTVSWLICNT